MLFILRHRPIRPFLDSETIDHCLCYCWFQIRLSQFHSYRHFFLQYPSSSARSKLLGSSRYSLNYQHHLSCKFTSLAFNSAMNQFYIGYSCPPFTPQRWPSILVIFTTSLYAIASSCQLRSAFLNLLSQPRINITLASVVSTCWRLAID